MPDAASLTSLTLAEAARGIRERELSPVELTAALLARIQDVDARLNAFITLTLDEALRDARAAEDEIERGRYASAVHGVPLALKDLFDTAGVRTTAGARFYAGRVPDADACVVERLRTARAVFLGKLNMHEWALGVTNVNPHFGPCRNPWALDRIAGGSSGGSAAAVAAGLCLGALGTDTGGSIRIPAALCGVVGLKPTYGRVSTRGVVPLSWSLDHVGPIARTAHDAALMLQSIAGYDGADPGSIDRPVDDYVSRIDGGVSGWVIGLVGENALGEVDSDVQAAVRAAAAVFDGLGARVVRLDAPELGDAPRLNGLVTTADAATFHRERLERSPESFGIDVLTRLRRGAGFGSTDYASARRAQAVLRRRFESWFTVHGGELDVVMMPTTPCAAPPIAGLDAVEIAPILTRFTAPFNLTGLPALSLPCGFSADGLPIGLQLVAAPWGEARLLRAARAYEQATPWHRRRPAIGD